MHPHSVSPSYFVKLYRRNPDPWNFSGSEHEHRKYDACLDVLAPRYDRALELGCSIGVFTQRLSARCRSVLAVDVSPDALESARRRNSGRSAMRFRQAIVPDEFPAGRFDLITLCEMGYYLNRDDLARTIARIAHALPSGGELLLVHWSAPIVTCSISSCAISAMREPVFESLEAVVLRHLNALAQRDITTFEAAISRDVPSGWSLVHVRYRTHDAMTEFLLFLLFAFENGTWKMAYDQGTKIEAPAV